MLLLAICDLMMSICAKNGFCVVIFYLLVSSWAVSFVSHYFVRCYSIIYSSEVFFYRRDYSKARSHGSRFVWSIIMSLYSLLLSFRSFLFFAPIYFSLSMSSFLFSFNFVCCASFVFFCEKWKFEKISYQIFYYFSSISNNNHN